MVDPRTTALEEINKHSTYIITFTHGVRTNSDNNDKKRVMQKEKGKFHSFNKTSLKQIPMFQKIVMVKKKQQQHH